MFDRLDLLIGKNRRLHLADMTVVVVGVGGVGGYVVEALARSGIGRFVLIDHDIVDVSNKNRQIIALNSTVGRKKVDVMKERILDICPECKVDTLDLFLEESNFSELYSYDINYLIDCCDTISTKKTIIQECSKHDIPFISSMGTGNKLDPSQLEILDIRKTSYDPLARHLRKFVKDEKISSKVDVLCSREQPISTGSRVVGSTSFVPSSAGLLIASYVVRKLLDIR